MTRGRSDRILLSPPPSPSSRRRQLSAGAQTVEFVLLQGVPIGEPVVQHGPFVMTSQREIMQAFQDYQRTGFGDWPHGGDAPVFAREKGRFSQAPGAALVEKPIPR